MCNCVCICVTVCVVVCLVGPVITMHHIDSRAVTFLWSETGKRERRETAEKHKSE